MKKGFLAVSLAGLVAVSGAALVTGTAFAAPNVTCGPGQTLSGTYNNVTVPSTDNFSNFCTISSRATVEGQVIVQSGGAVYIAGTIGSLSSNSAGVGFGDPLGIGAPFNFSVLVCDAIVKGPLSVNGSSSAVLIGDDDARCDIDSLGRSNTVSNNRGGVEIVGNIVNGN